MTTIVDNVTVTHACNINRVKNTISVCCMYACSGCSRFNNARVFTSNAGKTVQARVKMFYNTNDGLTKNHRICRTIIINKRRSRENKPSRTVYVCLQRQSITSEIQRYSLVG